MKNSTIVIADRNAINYFCLLNPVQAKKVLFAMSLLKGDQRLSDSDIAEVRRIAACYDGVINAAFARELAAKLAAEYSKLHPGVLLTKKGAESYTHAKYRKLHEAFGIYGLDYVVTALANAKVRVANPANGIEERHMLNALRWDERREGYDPKVSNERHRRKGIYLLGMGDMLEVLLPYSFDIASVYEMVSPANYTQEYTEVEESEAEAPMTIGEMVLHFVENAHLLKDFYGTAKPVMPEAYLEEQLREDSLIYALAKKNKLDDSEAVLNYVEQKKMYESCTELLAETFTEAELHLITEKGETIKEILRLVASL